MSDWSVTAGSGEGGYEKAPPGNHPAVLVGLIDLGDQWQDGFQGADGKYERRIYWVYELVAKKKQGGGGNHLMAIDLKLSMHEKAKMRKFVEARTGKKVPDGTEYDISQELGKPVLLQVVKKGDFPKVEGVSAVPDGFAVPDPLTKPTAWKLDPARVDDIPGWVPYLYGTPIKDVVRGCRQIKGDTRSSPQRPAQGGQAGFLGENAEPVNADDIPF